VTATLIKFCVTHTAREIAYGPLKKGKTRIYITHLDLVINDLSRAEVVLLTKNGMGLEIGML